MTGVRLPDEQEQLRAHLRSFVEGELLPLVERMEADEALPPELLPLLASQGYLGMRLPAAYGGAEADMVTYGLVLEEFSRAHTILTLICDMTTGLAPQILARHGTEDQRRAILPGLARGEAFMAFALSEPGAGSDTGALATRARRDGDAWRLNGMKHYISGGAEADHSVVIAVTGDDPRRPSAFLVPKSTPGFTVTRSEKTIADAVISLAELTFDDCMLPLDALLGQEGDGMRYASASLVEGRLGVALSCIGVADRVIELSAAHTLERRTFGAPLADRQAIQWMLADSAVELEAARALAYGLLTEEDAPDALVRSSMVKLFASEMAGRVTDRGIQIHGGMGVVRGVPVESFFRQVRHYRIGEGASEIHRMIIAKALLREAGRR